MSLPQPTFDEPSPGAEPRRRPRRRDRHARGLRGSLAPSSVPLGRTRPEQFDDLVLDAVERIERLVSRSAEEVLIARLAEVEFGVEEVPPGPALSLGRAEEPAAGEGGRVVLYRRPIEARAKDLLERAELVHEVVVDQLAELLGVSPELLDPPP